MPEFQLDTSGEVLCIDPSKPCVCHAKRWDYLDAFTQGYIEAMFFTAEEQLGEDYAAPPHNVEPMGTGSRYKPGFSDLSAEALQSIITDCQKFQDANARRLQVCDEEDEGLDGNSRLYPRRAGQDFWYTRNGHGCGFWDGDWPEPHATVLTDAAKGFPEVTPYVDDDGRIYLA